ncbi:MAG: hypothetical protein R3F30_05675 [Planctomycetota bacterium]
MIRRFHPHVLALALFATAGLRAQIQDDDLYEPKDVTMEQVRGNATAFKNVHIRFTCQFHGIGAVHNPFFTRFTRADFANFAVWGDNQKIWNEGEYQNPLPGLFVAKIGRDETLKTIYQLQRYQRIEVTGIVRNVFLDEPWIEVFSVTPVANKVSIPTLTHMHKAVDYMAQRKWALAGSELNQAMTSELPTFYQGWIHAYMGECFMRLGKADNARTQLSYAMDFLPNELSVAQNLQTVTHNPKAGIDTMEDAGKGIPKNLEPVWVAVEEPRSAPRGSSSAGPGR